MRVAGVDDWLRGGETNRSCPLAGGGSVILDDERKKTAAAFWACAHAYSSDRGITVIRALPGNGSC